VRAPDRGGDRRHVDHVAVVADAHLGLTGPVDALDALEEAVDEVGAELLAVRDHVDPGRLLLLQPDQRRILLGALDRLPLVAPGSPELLRLGQPRGLRQAAGYRGLEHDASPCSASRRAGSCSAQVLGTSLSACSISGEIL
jgi:hypothetical protein